ncbi:DUF6448 family protein [Cytobacillus praedii]|uniref:DUF6448 family protein n=1 Tax=Cytobacillus praedii TaxID=1742358 RepID=UPI002E23A563|nr:DUF6448 family protein [Cytobacillus praedii]
MNLTLSKVTGTLFLSLGIIAFVPSMASAHCDTIEGPVISDAKQALETQNINYILKWVFPEDEEELTKVFEKTLKVRDQSPEVQELADQYLFENLVRIHRAGEGASFTGVQPEGTPMDEAIIAADKSIEVGDLAAFNGLIEEERMHELEEKFDRVLATKEFDVNDLEAGREFVEAYVQYTHFAEGEEGHREAHATEGEHTDMDVDDSKEPIKPDESNSTNWLPWSLAGLFLITTFIPHLRKHKH